MHNTYDRDLSIRINWENVRDDRIDSFDMRPPTQISNFNVPFDVGSVMHYSQTTSSANGLPTMTALFNPHGRTMGQRIEATPEDFLRINRMYGCPLFPYWVANEIISIRLQMLSNQKVFFSLFPK